MRKLKYQNLLGITAALSAGFFGAGEARAALSYAYGQQTITGLTVTGSGLTGATVNGSSTDDSAAVGGPGVANNDPTDASLAYLLTPPPSPQNSFVKYSTTGGGPQAGDFTRGDVQLLNKANLFTTGISASTVAESITTGSNGLLTGASDWNINGTFNLDGNSVTVSYSFANDIIDVVSGASASADSQFGLLMSIKDQHGHEVDAMPSELNTTLAAPANGPELISSGTGSAIFSTAGLTAGDTYTISIDAQSHSSAFVPSVPEPASMSLISIGAVGLLARRRRNSRA